MSMETRPLEQADIDALMEPRLPEGNTIVITTGDLLGLAITACGQRYPNGSRSLGYDADIDSETRASNPEILECLWEKNPYLKCLTAP